jgi:hypothetical protein
MIMCDFGTTNEVWHALFDILFMLIVIALGTIIGNKIYDRHKDKII